MDGRSLVTPGAEGWTEERAHPRPLLLVFAWAVAIGAVFLLRLGAAPLFDVDEGAFAEATRELVQSGDLGSTTLNGLPRFDKPILAYWLQGASVAAFGADEGFVRLPSALCAILWSVAVAAFAWGRLGPARALLAGTITATSVGVLIIGRAATADALLNLLLVLSLLDGWAHLESGRRAPLLRAYLWMGLGLLAKGPVALLVPSGAALLYLASRREARRLVRLALDPVGWAILLGVAAPWYGYALHRHGWAFVDGFLLRHNVGRFLAPLEEHRGSAAYYLVYLPVMLLPWAPLLPALLRRIPSLWAQPLERFLLCWAGFVLVFFSLCATKLPHYVLYGATPLFLLLARTAPLAGRASRAFTIGAIWALLALCAAGPWIAPVVAQRLANPLARALLSAPPPPAALAASVAALVAGAAWSLSRRWVLGFEPRAALGALLAALALAGFATPWMGELVQGPVKRLALAAWARPEPAVQWNVGVPSFAFYRGRAAPRRPPRPGELAVVRVDRLAPSPDVEVVQRERGYALVRRGAVPGADAR